MADLVVPPPAEFYSYLDHRREPLEALQSLHATASSKGFPAVLAPLNDYDKVEFLTSPICVIVCSTTGNGDPPNNAEDFWRFVRKRTHAKDLLSNLKYAVLGLGDTNYDKFCASAKGIVKRFSELAASPFYQSTYADEAVGLESVVDPWTQGLWPALEAAIASTLKAELPSEPVPAAVVAAAPAPLSVPVPDANKPEVQGAALPDAGADGAAQPSEAQAEPLSPMSAMRQWKALQAEQRERRRSRQDSVEGQFAASMGFAAGLPSVLHDLSAGGALDGDGDVTAVGTGQTIVHVHTHGVRPAPVSSEAGASSIASAAGAGVAAGTAASGGGGAGGPGSAASATAANGSDITLDTRGKHTDDIVELAAQAAARAVGQDLARLGAGAGSHVGGLQAAGAAQVAVLPGVAASNALSSPPMPAGGSDSGQSASGLSIRAPLHSSTSLPSLALAAEGGAGAGTAVGQGAATTAHAIGNGGTTAAAHIVVPSHESTQTCVTSVALQPTPGVRGVFQLFPSLVHHSKTTGGAAVTARPEDVIPPASVSSSAKLFPKEPALTVAVKVLTEAEAVAVRDSQAASGAGAAGTLETAAAARSSLASGSSQSLRDSSPRPGNGSPRAGAGSLPGSRQDQHAASGAGASALGRSLEQPVHVPITHARYLTSGGRASDRRVVHMEVDVTGTPLAQAGAWSPGDSIGIVAPNDSQEVDRLCQRLGYHPLARIEVSPVACASTAAAGGSAGVGPSSLSSSSSSDTPQAQGQAGATAAATAGAVSLPIAIHKTSSGFGLDSAAGAGTPATGTPGIVPGKPTATSGAGAAAVVSPTGAATSPQSLPIYFPSWLPGYPHPTLHDVLAWTLDIHVPPKKAFVRLLAESCKADEARGVSPHAAEMDKDVLMWLAGRAGKDAFKTVVEDQRLGLTDLLALFPSCQPSLSGLLSTLPALAPRYYSLTCSPLACPTRLSVAFTVVQYEVSPALGVVSSALPLDTPNPAAAVAMAQQSAAAQPAAGRIARHGLATTWLERLCEAWLDPAQARHHAHAHASGHPEGSSTQAGLPIIRAFLRPSKDFLPPASPSTPTIMIGPGTGVAPFLGFLQHRAAKMSHHDRAATAACTGMWRGKRLTTLREDKEHWQPMSLGQSLLFFGNRRPDVDFLYREELSDHVGKGTLGRLVTAWSRETPGHKQYVQHKLLEPELGRTVTDLILTKGASVYVCGDGAHMAKDVHNALVAVLDRHGQELMGSVWGKGAATPAPVATPLSPPRAPATPGVTPGPDGACTTPGAASPGAEFLADMAKRGRYVRDIWS